jgi:hypothetical protein
MKLRFGVWGALLCLSVSSAARAQEARHVVPVARVVATAGVAGRFAEARCTGSERIVPHPSVGFTGALSEATEEGTLLVDTGGLLAPHGVMRFANRDLPDAVAEMVHGLGYGALAFGENDLGAPRARTLTVASALHRRGIDYVATNLRCESEHPLCAAVRDASEATPLVNVGSERAAFLAFLDPEVLARVAPDRSDGLRIQPIDESLAAAVRTARAQGATLVIAVVDITSDQAFDLAGALPDDARPDVLLLADAGARLLFARPASVVPAIISPPPGSGVEVLVGRSDEMTRGFEMLAVPIEAGAPAAPVTRFLETVGGPYCEAWGRALPGGHLDRPIAVPQLAELTAQIIREFGGADVAFLNAEVIDSSFRTVDPAQLTASDLYVAIAYDEPLVVADVPASWLREALDQAADHGILTPGLANDGDGEEVESLRIRGRPPVPNASYRVTTIRFLAEGGDGALPPLPEGSHWQTLTHRVGAEHRYHSLREVVIEALDRSDARDPRDARVAAGDAPEWILRGTIDGDFAGSSTDNPVGYDAALLATETSIAMGLTIDLEAIASAPDWSWESRLTGSFRTQWAPSTEPGVAGTFVEAQDQIQLRSLASYRGLRSDPTAVYIPDLYIEAFAESEVTRPEETRDFHWLLLRPTAGVRFPLTQEFELKLQAGIQGQALQTGAEAEFGAGASVRLNSWTIFTDEVRSLTAEGMADFFCADLFDQNRWQLRSSLDLALDLVGPLALTFGATLYMQDEASQGVGLSFSATAGLRLSAVNRSVGP